MYIFRCSDLSETDRIGTHETTASESEAANNEITKTLTLSEETRKISSEKRANVPSINSNKKFECRVCSKDLKTAYALVPHLMDSHKISVLTGKEQMWHKCPYCSKRFKSSEVALEHVRTEHDKPFRCMTCKAYFDKENHLKIHERSYCQRFFHPSVEMQSDCRYCKLPVSRKKLSSHMVQCEFTTRAFRCKHCLDSFDVAELLKLHVETKHNQKDGTMTLQTKLNYRCVLCRKSFKSDGALKEHARVKHTMIKIGNKPAIALKFALETLYIRKSKKVMYQCLYCPHKFDTIKSVAGHLKRKHTGEAFELTDGVTLALIDLRSSSDLHMEGSKDSSSYSTSGANSQKTDFSQKRLESVIPGSNIQSSSNMAFKSNEKLRFGGLGEAETIHFKSEGSGKGSLNDKEASNLLEPDVYGEKRGSKSQENFCSETGFRADRKRRLNEPMQGVVGEKLFKLGSYYKTHPYGSSSQHLVRHNATTGTSKQSSEISQRRFGPQSEAMLHDSHQPTDMVPRSKEVSFLDASPKIFHYTVPESVPNGSQGWGKVVSRDKFRCEAALTRPAKRFRSETNTRSTDPHHDSYYSTYEDAKRASTLSFGKPDVLGAQNQLVCNYKPDYPHGSSYEGSSSHVATRSYRTREVDTQVGARTRISKGSDKNQFQASYKLPSTSPRPYVSRSISQNIFTCTVCGASFMSNAALKMHVEVNHLERLNPF